MLKRIRPLPAIIANQIAAGEVIERPASVVKELLENALDAEADSIAIEIGFGGLNQIKISDNGTGILEADLPLAIAAHATSKITQLSDLNAIASLGFRGEALASIASISRLTISSKPAGQENAMKLRCIQQDIQLEPCARSQGTTIDVRDIFFNAPVRKKFLKSDKIEFQAIEQLVKRFAMSSPSIALQLTHNGKRILNLPAAHTEPVRLQRMAKLLGNEFMSQAIQIVVSHAGFNLQGFISHPSYQRNQNDKQWVYVNGRMVKDKLINHALKQAYEAVLYPGKHPACLLYLTLDPADVDVNVHPTKHELRFQQPRLVHDFLTSQIQKALNLSTPSANYEPLKNDPSTWKVRELSRMTITPESPSPQSPSSNLNLMAIDERYKLIKMGNQVYLTDFLAIQEQWFIQTLMKQPLPLAHRPLLVPVHYQSERLEAVDKDSYLSLLEQMGLRLEWPNKDECLLRSIPLIAPDLQIKPFLEEVFSSAITSTASLLPLLAKHQPLQPDLTDFMHYLEHHVADLSKTLCKPLSTQTCEDWLHA